MRLIANHILTPIFYLIFVLILLIFHPIQLVVYYLFGDMAHRRVVYIMNKCLSMSLHLLGHSIKFVNQQELPSDRPLIFVANHNSLHDIPTLYSALRKFNPVFVSKLSLAKGLPSVSFNLRKSGAALIDRGDRMQSMKEIMRLGQMIKERGFSAVIFPEGTRKGSTLKSFKPGGVAALLRKAPDALVVPVVIEGTMNINMHRAYPLNSFQRLKWTVLDPLDPKDYSLDELMVESRARIASVLGVE